MSNSAWVIIEGEPFLGKALAYKESVFEYSRLWEEFASRMGASNPCGAFPGRRPAGLIFNNRSSQRDGWTKIDREGFSRPKKGHNDLVLFKRLPVWPNPRDVFGDILQENLSYSMPDGGWGSSAIGPAFGPRIGWAGETIVALIAHASRAAENCLAKDPERTITNGADKWEMPEGLREMSKAEKDLIFAEHAVAAEREA